jgi:hypothetical protein
MHAISSATYYKTFSASKIISPCGFLCDMTHPQFYWPAQQTLKVPI